MEKPNREELDSYLQSGADALRKAALNEEAKNYILENPSLYRVLRRAADRYIGGETLEETLPKVRTENDRGYKCSVEFMGESTRNEKDANDATDEFCRIVDRIRTAGLNATVSLDLSHIGLAVSADLAAENLERLCSAASPDIEVTLSAEGVERTDDVLRCYRGHAHQFPNLSITVQAYLYRTEEDIAALLELPGRIRVVKGAFETPPGHAMPRGEELNRAYLGYVEELLERGHPCSIATHDPTIQTEAEKLVRTHGAAPENYEFESLYGICSEQLAQLKGAGHPAKLYFVYGSEWYLYVCNRIAEYPLNLFRALSDVVGSADPHDSRSSN